MVEKHFSRRDFFCAIAASAFVAVGANKMPTGFPLENGILNLWPTEPSPLTRVMFAGKTQYDLISKWWEDNLVPVK